jgi:hypothetical protein
MVCTVLVLLSLQECNGNTATATVDMPFVQGSTATDDSYRYVGGRVT